MVFVLLSFFSVVVLAEEGKKHDLVYTGAYFDTSKLCDGKLYANIVLDNQGEVDEEVYVHVYSNDLDFDGFSQIMDVSEGESVMLGVSDNVGIVEVGFLEGLYGVEVELFNDGFIKNYPEKLYFEGCVKESDVNVFVQSINSGDLEENSDDLEENISNDGFSMDFSTILFIVLSIFMLLIVVVFIISSYIVI